VEKTNTMLDDTGGKIKNVALVQGGVPVEVGL